MRHLCIALSAVAALTACAAVVAEDSATAERTYLYRCADGSTLEVRYPDTNAAILRRGDQSIDLRIARSASGARYVSESWEWWTKGQSGTLSPLQPGEDIASVRGVDCTLAS
jgi:membrane-bound inhibitor of C-type lysozyme